VAKKLSFTVGIRKRNTKNRIEAVENENPKDIGREKWFFVYV
jgi:hypothetical protein